MKQSRLRHMVTFVHFKSSFGAICGACFSRVSCDAWLRWSSNASVCVCVCVCADGGACRCGDTSQCARRPHTAGAFREGSQDTGSLLQMDYCLLGWLIAPKICQIIWTLQLGFQSE